MRRDTLVGDRVQRGERLAESGGDGVAVAALRDQPQHAARHGFAGDAARDEEAAAEPVRVAAVAHDVGDWHASRFGGADRLRLERDRRQFDVRVRNRSDDQCVTCLPVVGIEQYVQPACTGAGHGEPRNLDVALPVFRQEAHEPFADRVRHGSSTAASQAS
jgi:hypothetical protein